MSQTDSSYIRTWGRDPEAVVAEPLPPERSRWRDKSDDDGADTEGWEWVFNIPTGARPLGAWAWDVRALQVKYGCQNVASGNAYPLQDMIGVYVHDDGQIRHREGPICRCDEKLPDREDR